MLQLSDHREKGESGADHLVSIHLYNKVNSGIIRIKISWIKKERQPMPRKKQFAVEDVRQKAMVTFWSRGYNATSLQDLVGTMGINRASLYETFNDKYSLFLDSLSIYKVIYIKSYLAKQTKKYTPREAIIHYFGDMILKADERNGCLMVNTALELSPHDEKVAKIVDQSFHYIERNFFRRMIERGQVTGEIAKSVIPITTARALLSLLIGLCVLSRSNANKPVMQAIVSQVKSLLPLGDNVALLHPTSRPSKNHSGKVRHQLSRMPRLNGKSKEDIVV